LSILSQRTLFYQTVYEDLMERIRRGEAVNPIWSESRWRQLIRGSRSEAELADYILCPSKAVADSFVQNGTSPDKLILLPYGVDTTRFDEVKIESSDGDRFRILFVGRISRAKGVHELIEAFRDLNASDAELVLVGRDTGEIDIASLQNEMKNVRHLGWLPSAQLNEVYMRSDLFICPSLYEGAGNVIYEAMLAGLPVIVGRAGSSAVEDGVTGFVLNDVHAPELRSKIEYLYRQRELRKSVGQNARETMRKRSWETYQLHVRRIVTELCQSHTQ
jgi:glycosyltransferase involved in cell wall biosynthesis